MAALLTEDNTRELLKQANDKKVQELSKDIATISAFSKILNRYFDILSNQQMSGRINFVEPIKIAMELESSYSGRATQGVEKVIHGTTSIMMANSSLFKLGKLSPQQAVATVSFVVLEKAMLAGGLSERHKCEMAIGSLAATGGLTLATGATGIGLVIGVIGVMAAGLDAYNACMIRE